MQEDEVSDNPISIIETVHEKSLSEQTVTIDKEMHTDSPKMPKFVLKAIWMDVQKSQALMSVNKEESQWFQVGDKVIDNYFIHDINRSFITLIQNSSAYYEISLSDSQPQYDSSNVGNASNTESALEMMGIDVEDMISLGDGQYISYGDEDMSNITGENEDQNHTKQEINEYDSEQSIIYGDEDMSIIVGEDDRP